MKTTTYPLQSHIKLPEKSEEPVYWGQLYGSAGAMSIIAAAHQIDGVVVAITSNMSACYQLEQELRFYSSREQSLPVLMFPDWETLPYDIFSPHQDIISQRLETLHKLQTLKKGILVVPVSTLMHRLPPCTYLQAHSFVLNTGDKINLEKLRADLIARGYYFVNQTMEHGEFALRGNIFDIFPMGSQHPYRIELFDDEVESIRTFNPENQRSIEKVQDIHLLPAREIPLDEQAIELFKSKFDQAFPESPHHGIIYRDVTKQLAPPGIEYYLPLFFENTSTLFDYLPQHSLFIIQNELETAATGFWKEVCDRYEQNRFDIERPLLSPEIDFIPEEELLGILQTRKRVQLQSFEITQTDTGQNFGTGSPPVLTLNKRAHEPAEKLLGFTNEFDGRILFVAESAGRRELLLEILKHADIHPRVFETWNDFIHSENRIGIAISPLENGALITSPSIAVITEPQLFGEQVMQRRRRKTRGRDTESIISNLTELSIGAPVVHDDYGVGRYLGLQMLTLGDLETEFLTLEYAGGDKLYVPVSSLQLINRYTGVNPDQAPLHKLGSGQWERAKRKAAEKVRDVAAELLDIHTRRAARKGNAFPEPDEQYNAFVANFPFEETPDQEDAIHSVVEDLVTDKPMDRVICGDVGFGKTEVALRAAFVAVQGGKQVVMLVPTTLLAEQHYQTFTDRFADWPVKVESLSRFRSAKQQKEILKGLANGKVDIVIGTHRLLQDDVKFSDLGLVIVDEEHRFGVRHKEKMKTLRAEVDILTLTATPIPRTLNMSLSGIRDLSVIATPPRQRIAIKTFVTEWQDHLLREAILREIKRGGQVYFLHNEVKTIEKKAREIAELVPEATVRIGHGQMREHDLEQVMLDFYHQRFNVLVCTTIIESGIDIPTANTIIMDRADKLGLAQLYQLRGRVGRSHHRSYAYLIVPDKKVMTADARKRLEAIESLEELGTGFTLATHDLEIRGAGELLGEEQSGNMQEIGFGMYTELLERAVASLRAGKQPELDRPLDHGTEVDLRIPALIPEDYLPDIHTRLLMYKRIASANSRDALKDMQVEMIDRFGLLPEPVKYLFQVTELKLKATPLGIRKIEASPDYAKLVFGPEPNIDPAQLIQMIQKQPNIYKFDGKTKLRITKDLGEI
ncbi:MAG: transcription-repair coupling factor, partial [Gammaproteobacteria bacterium]|nr:transcription-repair coupling factor [Gammaproteobacteria bacterium]